LTAAARGGGQREGRATAVGPAGQPAAAQRRDRAVAGLGDGACRRPVAEGTAAGYCCSWPRRHTRTRGRAGAGHESKGPGGGAGPREGRWSAVVAGWPENMKKKLHPWKFAGKLQRKRKKRRGNDQTVMDSTKRIHYGVENDEIYLKIRVVDAGTRRFSLKNSPKSSPAT